MRLDPGYEHAGMTSVLQIVMPGAGAAGIFEKRNHHPRAYPAEPNGSRLFIEA
jgi:hypothetical protein